MGLDEVPNDLKNSIMPQTISPKLHSLRAVVQYVFKCLSGALAEGAGV